MDAIDVLLRRRLKKSIAHIKSPPGGRKRLLNAAQDDRFRKESRHQNSNKQPMIFERFYSNGLSSWGLVNPCLTGIVSLHKLV